MSESEWKGPLFDPPQVRREVEQPVRVEQPADIEVRQVVAPPAPDERQAVLHAVQNDPQLAAELWRQVDAAETAPAQPPDKSQTIAQLGLALYLLQTLHTQDKPGYEHLIREQPAPDEDEDPNIVD
jgi:hypothetical protein